MNIPEGWPTEISNEVIRIIALQYGFKLKEQLSGEDDLNPYVYTFARKLINMATEKAAVAAPTPAAQEDEHDSYLTNCHIISRQEEDKPLFVGSGDRVFCRLDRYTVMPTEQYDELRKAAEEYIRLTEMADLRFQCEDHDRDHMTAYKNLHAVLNKK